MDSLETDTHSETGFFCKCFGERGVGANQATGAAFWLLNRRFHTARKEFCVKNDIGHIVNDGVVARTCIPLNAQAALSVPATGWMLGVPVPTNLSRGGWASERSSSRVTRSSISIAVWSATG